MIDPTAMNTADPSGAFCSSSGFEWRAAHTRYYSGGEPLPDQLAKATPSADELIVWANRKSNQPPDDWWDDDDDPFSPET